MIRTTEKIPFCPGYYVTRKGKVYYQWEGKAQPVEPKPDEGGLLYVELMEVNRRSPTVLYVHHLVAQAFHQHYVPGMPLVHRDGNPQNNHISNLATHIDIHEEKLRKERIEANKVNYLTNLHSMLPNTKLNSMKTNDKLGIESDRTYDKYLDSIKPEGKDD